MTALSYLELPAPKLTETKKFYAAGFGWEWIDYGPTYAATSNSSLEVGLNGEALPSPTHPAGDHNAIGPFPLFSTDDLERTLTKVANAGGVIVSEPYDFPGGRRFHFQDPSGNILGVFQVQ
jgi:predicted enzyme related to lactoylglutathione lyase